MIVLKGQWVLGTGSLEVKQLGLEDDCPGSSGVPYVLKTWYLITIERPGLY